MGGGVFLGILVKFSEILFSEKDSLLKDDPFGWLFDPTTYFYSFILGGGGVLIQILTTFLTTRNLSNSREKFIRDLPDKKGTKVYSDFIEKIAECLTGINFPRLILIDNFEGLDSTTQKALIRYSIKHCDNAIGSEFWVVFEGTEGERLRNYIIETPEIFSNSKFELFGQKYLTDVEKKDLVKIVGRPDNAIEFSAVKWICRETTSIQNRFYALFKEYREIQPYQKRTYDAFDIVYWLALTVPEGTCFFTKQFLLHIFSEKSGLKAKILEAFFRGTNLKRSEIDSGLTLIKKDMPWIFDIETKEDAKEIRIKMESANTLLKHAKEFKLPDSSLGHIFWALQWYDGSKNQINTFWIKKITYHLLYSDVLAIEEKKLRENVLKELIEAHLYILNASLKTCLFEKLILLLQKTSNYIQDLENESDFSCRKRFLKICWEAFSILGHEDILGIILEIWEISSEKNKKLQVLNLGELDGFFLETMQITELKRKKIDAGFRFWNSSTSKEGDSILNYSRVQSIWLIQNLVSFLDGNPNSQFFQIYREAVISLDKLTNDICKNVQEKLEESVKILDLMALSQAIWCHALNVCLVCKNDDEDKKTLVELYGKFVAIKKTEGLIDLAETLVVMAGEIWREDSENFKSGKPKDFLVNGLARELCAISLASILVSLKCISEIIDLKIFVQLLQKVQSIFQEIERLLDYPFPSIRKLEDVISESTFQKVDDLMKLCQFTWHTFSLFRLRDFVNIRRMHCTVLFKRLTPYNFKEFKPLLDSVGSPAQERGISGLLANIVIANCVKCSGELVAHYLCQTGGIVLEGEFGNRMKQDMAILVIKNGSSNVNLQKFLNHLLENFTESESKFFNFIKQVPEEDILGTILKFINACKNINDKNTSKKFWRQIELFIGTLDSISIKEELNMLFEIECIREGLSEGRTIEFFKFKDKWQSKKDSWLYPSLLCDLLISGYKDPDLKNESLLLLNRDPKSDLFNTYFHLALKLAENTKVEQSDDIRVYLEYLKKGITKWQAQNSAEINYNVYKVLYLKDLKDSEKQVKYLWELEKWGHIKLQRDHLERIPQLAKRGRFFLIFQDYCDSMEIYGLPFDLEEKDLYKTHTETQNPIMTWKLNDGRIPEPIAIFEGCYVVSRKYVSLGRFLYSPPIDQDQNYSEIRTAFDLVAQENLSNLVNLIANLPNLPRSFKDLLLSYHQSRFQTFLSPNVG